MRSDDTRVQQLEALTDEDTVRGGRLDTNQPPEGTAEPPGSSLKGPENHREPVSL